MQPVDIGPAERETVRRILRDHAPGIEACAFGSRVSWTARETSDLDLVLMTEAPLEAVRLASLRAAFTDSDLPFRVDVVDWASTSETFREVIEREHVVLVEGEEPCAAGWKKVTLGDLIDLRLSSVDKKTKPTEHPVRLCNYMDVYKNQFIHSGLDFMNGTATAREISNCTLRSGDVVITKDSEKHDDIGVPALVREDIPGLVCGYHLAILRSASPNIDGAYLFYALNTHEIQKQFHSYANGITRFGLRKSDIGLIEIPLPPLSEQRAIAGVLGVLDEKIEVNRRMNQTLEAMAQALFQDWFIDFGPTCAKTAGHKPYLPKPIWNLFPNKLTNSKLGKIPEGWRPGRLGDIASAESRSVNPGSVHEDTPYIGLEHMPRKSIALAEWEGAGKVTSNKTLFKIGDILFGKLRPYFHKVGIAPLDGICSTDIVVVRPISKEWHGLVLCCVSTDRFVAFTSQRSIGTKMPRTNWKTMAQYELALPPSSLADEYRKATEAIIQRIVANAHQSRTLTALRDTLLPNLVSGKIRIQNCAAILQGLASSEPDSPFKGEA